MEILALAVLVQVVVFLATQELSSGHWLQYAFHWTVPVMWLYISPCVPLPGYRATKLVFLALEETLCYLNTLK